MKRKAFLKAVATGLAMPVWASAEEPGFTSLFDGKTLKGWHKNSAKIGHGTGGAWRVEDGVIAGEQDPPGSGNGGILLTDEKFGDFELRLELKPDWGCCSGLFLRGNEKGECWQVMVDYHDAGNVGHVYGEGVGGFTNRPYSIDGKYDSAKKLVGLSYRNADPTSANGFSISGDKFCQLYKVNEWNELRVTCVGEYPKIVVWINGQKVNEFDAGSFAGKGYDKEAVKAKLGREGSIAVQVHGGKGWPVGAKCRWRNIRVKKL